MSTASAEEAFAARLESAADPKSLFELLREDQPVYLGCSTASVVRMRGWLLLTLAKHTLPDSVIPFVLEELESGHDAYLVAAAARAMRSSRPDPSYTPFVLSALRYHSRRDETIAFENFGEIANSTEPTSVVQELLDTLAWLGPAAACGLPQIEALLESDILESVQQSRLQSLRDSLCPSKTAACCEWFRGPTSTTILSNGALLELPLEDQDGTQLSFADLFLGQPTILAFFYTRCDNPLKCSRVVSKLGHLQKRLQQLGLNESIRVVAITYDPEYDVPKRLRNYASDRGFRFDERNRAVRVVQGFESLCAKFHLGVNFSEVTVNRHRLELLVLDSEATVTARFERFEWNEEEVIRVADPLARSPERIANSTWMGPLATLALVLFPKCPICWATYFSFLGSLGLGTIPYPPWLQPLLGGLLILNIAIVVWRSWAKRRWLPVMLTVLGGIAVSISAWLLANPLLAATGIVLTLFGSLSVIQRLPRSARIGSSTT